MMVERNTPKRKRWDPSRNTRRKRGNGLIPFFPVLYNKQVVLMEGL